MKKFDMNGSDCVEASGTQMISQAVALFDQEKYQEAFKVFVEAYYRPNEDELRQNYESNVAL